jgi:hypothetical protein
MRDCPRNCQCVNCRRYAELLDAMRDIGRHPPASTVSADEPCSPEMEREVDDACGVRLLKVRVPEEWAIALHTEADRREVPLTVVLRERMKPVSAGAAADAVEAALPHLICVAGSPVRPIGSFYPGFTAGESEHQNWMYHGRDRVRAALDAAYPQLTREVAELRAEVGRLKARDENLMRQVVTLGLGKDSAESALREARESLSTGYIGMSRLYNNKHQEIRLYYSCDIDATVSALSKLIFGENDGNPARSS